jgi:hypothetical protein
MLNYPAHSKTGVKKTKGDVGMSNINAANLKNLVNNLVQTVHDHPNFSGDILLNMARVIEENMKSLVNLSEEFIEQVLFHAINMTIESWLLHERQIRR